MASVLDPKLGVQTNVVHCRSCGAPTYWSRTDKNDRPCMFDLDEQGNPTRQSHFGACPQAKQWTRKGPQLPPT